MIQPYTEPHGCGPGEPVPLGTPSPKPVSNDELMCRITTDLHASTWHSVVPDIESRELNAIANACQIVSDSSRRLAARLEAEERVHNE